MGLPHIRRETGDQWSRRSQSAKIWEATKNKGLIWILIMSNHTFGLISLYLSIYHKEHDDNPGCGSNLG
jgi:hypothetical protein